MELGQEPHVFRQVELVLLNPQSRAVVMRSKGQCVHVIVHPEIHGRRSGLFRFLVNSELSITAVPLLQPTSFSFLTFYLPHSASLIRDGHCNCNCNRHSFHLHPCRQVPRSGCRGLPCLLFYLTEMLNMPGK